MYRPAVALFVSMPQPDLASMLGKNAHGNSYRYRSLCDMPQLLCILTYGAALASTSRCSSPYPGASSCQDSTFEHDVETTASQGL